MHEREIPNKRIAKGKRKKEEGFIFNSIIERKTSLMCETFARHGQAMEARTSIGTRHVDSLVMHVMQTPIKVPHHIVVPSSLSDANCDVDLSPKAHVLFHVLCFACRFSVRFWLQCNPEFRTSIVHHVYDLIRQRSTIRFINWPCLDESPLSCLQPTSVLDFSSEWYDTTNLFFTYLLIL